ncbi:5-formyltetrahydrofolate cyclo-ligase [Chlamydia ibidis]|uniref:5-formyltetrahydrofolate cyclo-ligase n=2 Tax=Chlamydia ibidis TaxID=1405396 RepID=S7J2K5_9CHLA|nr:5-formyltetrahydrofolate cyclo-ligase [Chlamydia ibidis]EPP34468.1 5-formyltetrahydrofolate cyclo-ligase [Chlamydia ibidis]EQM63158.1 5-formyltetrahydrofolate cyclo-ligase [Chlamydia ibidis 10-1398/6]
MQIISSEKQSEKKFLRNHLQKVRNCLPQFRIIEASLKLRDFVHTLPKNACVMSFVSYKSEISTRLANTAILEHCTLILPHISNKTMVPVIVRSIDVLSQLTNPLDFSNVDLDIFPTTDITHVLVPGLAFDNDGYRLGYGGGYYDRWLAQHLHTLSIGIGYREQHVPYLTRESHDFPVSSLFLC